MLLCYTYIVMTVSANPLLGKRLKKIREDKNMSQEDVAKAAGVSVGYYARVERGKHDPTTTKFSKICKALNVDPAKLLPK